MEQLDLYFGDIISTETEGGGEVRAQVGWADRGKAHATEVPILTPWGFASRPMHATDKAAAQAVYIRDGDEFHVIGTIENRYTPRLGAIKEGDVRVLHPSGSFVGIGFSDYDSMDAGDVTIYACSNTDVDVRNGEGTASKAGVIAMSAKPAEEYICLLHPKASSFVMAKDGSVYAGSHTGGAWWHLKDDAVIISGASVCITGGVSMGSDNPAAQDFVALATAVQANFELLLGLLQTWTPSAGDGGAALNTAAKLLTLAPVASSKVKAAF